MVVYWKMRNGSCLRQYNEPVYFIWYVSYISTCRVMVPVERAIKIKISFLKKHLQVLEQVMIEIREITASFKTASS